jgi:hypothetical protein
MKLVAIIVAVLLLFCGCAAEETYETVMDVWEEVPAPEAKSICVDLPGESAMPVMESDGGRVYVSSEYEIYVQTMPGGDIGATIEEMSGHPQESLTVLSTMQDDAMRYDFVWATAGEGGDMLGRGIILDDGSYHYTMTVLRGADTVQSSTVVWDAVFSSFRLD